MHLVKTLLAAGALLALAAVPASAQDKVSFGTDWLPQAEHGGYYQAVADGTYAKYGLDVTIVPGGPSAANRALLVAGKIDFYMGGVLGALDSVKEGVPMITVAAIFQKDPQVLIAHPESGFETFADLAGASKIIISKDVLITKWEWMKKTFEGFKDEQVESYQFNPAPFLADKNSIQQGYVTSEPFEIERQGGFKPDLFLFADAGYDAYSTTIETSKKLVEENPDLVKRFVEATIIGWYNYLYGDNAAANALIKAENPEMTDEQLAYSVAAMKDQGIVVSDAAAADGIGCMTDARWKSFFDKAAAIGLYDAALDYTQAFDAQFVCKGLGVELAK